MNELIRDIIVPLFDKVFKKLDTLEENITKLDKKITFKVQDKDNSVETIKVTKNKDGLFGFAPYTEKFQLFKSICFN